jgi:hypothetical protein
VTSSWFFLSTLEADCYKNETILGYVRKQLFLWAFSCVKILISHETKAMWLQYFVCSDINSCVRNSFGRRSLLEQWVRKFCVGRCWAVVTTVMNLGFLAVRRSSKDCFVTDSYNRSSGVWRRDAMPVVPDVSKASVTTRAASQDPLLAYSCHFNTSVLRVPNIATFFKFHDAA